ncbi:MAG: tetratricopeptide repeat protein [Spirosomataceae bacterium]
MLNRIAVVVGLLIGTYAQAQDSKVLLAQAVEQLKASKFEDGIKLLDQAISLDKNNPALWYNRGMAKSMLKRYEEALPDFEQVIKLNPKPKAYVARAIARKKLTDYDGALADLAEALRLDPKSGEALYNRAMIYEMQGLTDKACEGYRAAQRVGMPMAAVKVDVCDNPIADAPAKYALLRLTQTSTNPKYGFTKENPVRVGPGYNDVTENITAYLDLLRDAQGKPLRYKQTGSCCNYNAKIGQARIDIFEVIYKNAAGQDKKASVYITFGEYEEPQMLAGFKTVKGR